MAYFILIAYLLMGAYLTKVTWSKREYLFDTLVQKVLAIIAAVILFPVVLTAENIVYLKDVIFDYIEDLI